MSFLSLTLLCLAQLVQGTPTNTTANSSCPLLDGTSRSVWSILGSCAMTLLICVWHSVHFDISREKWHWTLGKRVLQALWYFVAPEVMVSVASQQWYEAHWEVIRFHAKGYEWSMTHCFFAEMGGFVYCNDRGELEKIDSSRFLELCEEKKIANPTITAKEIMAFSKSDALGKIILTLQLFWFTLQVVVRGSRGLAVTLVELDTVCMTVLSTLALFLWWDKPLRPDCPRVFYSPREVKGGVHTRSTLSKAWKSQSSCVHQLMSCLMCSRSTTDDEEKLIDTTNKLIPKSNGLTDKLVDKLSDNFFFFSPLCGTWVMLGGLHAVAWNFEFPTEVEKIIWRVASLVLAASPLLLLVSWIVMEKLWRWDNGLGACAAVSGILGVVSRVILVALMLASLRSLPCSAHQIVEWTLYIPHL